MAIYVIKVGKAQVDGLYTMEDAEVIAAHLIHRGFKAKVEVG